MTNTKIDLARKIYSFLRSEEGGSASDEDITLITTAIDQFCDTLSALDIITIQDTDDIDNGVFIPLAEYGAEQVCNEFGRAKSVQAEAIAIAKLRFIVRQRPTYEAQHVDYF